MHQNILHLHAILELPYILRSTWKYVFPLAFQSVMIIIVTVMLPVKNSSIPPIDSFPFEFSTGRKLDFFFLLLHVSVA